MTKSEKIKLLETVIDLEELENALHDGRYAGTTNPIRFILCLMDSVKDVHIPA